jgi:hypothetical protein
MSNTPTILQGKVIFVNHDKQYINIAYELAGKKKTINGSVDDKLQLQLKQQGIIKKTHIYHIGDVVNFVPQLSDRGDKMIAANIQYLYNTALDVLLNKAKTDNNFIGYLKLADDTFFVKEIESYIFFPLTPSPWRLHPSEKELNEAVTFSLENIDKKEKVTAKLFNNNYIPEFYIAIKLHKSQAVIDAVVYKTSAHSIYLNVIGDKVQGKIPPPKDYTLQVGDIVKVKITHMSPTKIVLEKVG